MHSFFDEYAAMLAYSLGKIGVHEWIGVRISRDQAVTGAGAEPAPLPADRRVITTVGRLLFADILPERMPFYNYSLSQKGAARVIADCHASLGRAATIDLLDEIKRIGFTSSTLAGLSFGVTDMRIPAAKPGIISTAQTAVDKLGDNFRRGALTRMERYNQVIDCWIHARERVTEAMMKELRQDYRHDDGSYAGPDDAGARPYLNPIFLMTESGARGSVDQIRQLAGMRALMAKPSGEIIETPIKANFREGLSVLEYFSSTHGARKGLADTALKTADSGYLTRKLADVAQNVIIRVDDCGTINGITKSAIYKGEEVDIPLRDSIVHRVARDAIRNPVTDKLIVAENQVITKEIALAIEELGLDQIRVRSPLTCESPLGLCATCYGVDMSTGQVVEQGMAVGIIAAQSIGEPGTQLTMRTFHTGGVAHKAALEKELRASQEGVVAFQDLEPVEVKQPHGGAQTVVLKRNGEILINDRKGRELERHKVPYGAILHVEEGQAISRHQALCEWDPHLTPILAEIAGFVRFQDISEGETVRTEEERAGSKYVVIEHKGEKHPQIVIEDKNGNVLDYHYLPAKARIEVEEGQQIKPGMLLARQPREMTGTQDITGGLPRVTEIFEARRPKEPAMMAEISGLVEIRGDKRRGKMTIIVSGESGMEKEHHVPQDRHLLVHAGDRVEAGDPLIDGPLIPHDILRIKGEEALWVYLLAEVQAVYRSQNVTINDKHIEVIVSQMLRKVRIEAPNDAVFLPGELVDKFRFRAENERLAKSVRINNAGDADLLVGRIIAKDELAAVNDEVESEGGEPAKGKKCKPASATTQLLGITKASLQSESFISAASFQETTKVLTEASLGGSIDTLKGLKENVILGHLIPAGTGFKRYLGISVEHVGEPLEQPTEVPGELAEFAEAGPAAPPRLRTIGAGVAPAASIPDSEVQRLPLPLPPSFRSRGFGASESPDAVAQEEPTPQDS